MKKLYHYPICPLSRQVRVCLKDLSVEFSLIRQDYWQNNRDFLRISPGSIVPVLEEPFGLIVVGVYSIIEYLNERYRNTLMDDDTDIRAEIRRLLDWFNNKMYHEVTKILIDEKVITLMSRNGSPKIEMIKLAKQNLQYHMQYISSLLETRSFLGGEKLSYADIAAASHISVLDYLGEINWDDWIYIRDWYSIIKSRPSFRNLLQDRIAGFIPPPCYADLDF